MEYQTTKYDVIQTGTYKDVHQLKLGYYKKDTTEFKVKSYPKTIEGQEKFFPISIPLGDKETATKFLVSLLKEITGEYYEVVNYKPQQATQEDVPF